MDSTQKITVRLGSDTMAVLQSFVDSGEYSSLSEVIFAAISDFIYTKCTQEDILKILANITDKKNIDMKVLMKNVEHTEMDEAVRKAVCEYIRMRMNSEE